MLKILILILCKIKQFTHCHYIQPQTVTEVTLEIWTKKISVEVKNPNLYKIKFHHKNFCVICAEKD